MRSEYKESVCLNMLVAFLSSSALDAACGSNTNITSTEFAKASDTDPFSISRNQQVDG